MILLPTFILETSTHRPISAQSSSSLYNPSNMKVLAPALFFALAVFGSGVVCELAESNSDVLRLCEQTSTTPQACFSVNGAIQDLLVTWTPALTGFRTSNGDSEYRFRPLT